MSQIEIAKRILYEELCQINIDTTKIKENGCVACHVMFTMANKMGISEQYASELLSELLESESNLNDKFIEIVETIHMKQRICGVTFSLKTRMAKDRYIDLNFKSFLEELSTDLLNYGSDIMLRKLLLSSISLQLAQNIGIDHHAAVEELNYYLRKNKLNTNAVLEQFIDKFYEKIIKRNK